MNLVEEFFKKENIYNEDFFEYIKNRVHYLPYNVSLDWFGCFPILDENNILIDFRIFVPTIKTEKNILVNIHEIYHGYELYNGLGKIYIEDREERERRAKSFERKYKLNNMI